jgi:ATP synthase protein I
MSTAPATAATLDVKILRSAGVATLVVGLVCVGVGGSLRGGPGVVGAAIATGIVLVFFTIGQFVLGRVLRTNPQMAMTVAMTVYLVKIGVLFVFILLFAGTTAFDNRVFALTIVICTLTWTLVEVWVFARTKVLTIEPGSGPGQPGGPR